MKKEIVEAHGQVFSVTCRLQDGDHSVTVEDIGLAMKPFLGERAPRLVSVPAALLYEALDFLHAAVTNGHSSCRGYDKNLVWERFSALSSALTEADDSGAEWPRGSIGS